MEIENTSSSQDSINYPHQKTSDKSTMRIIAGVLLIVAGILSITYSILTYFVLDISLIESLDLVTQLQQTIPDITPEQVLGFVKTCTIIFMVVSIFPIFGGILALKKKLWGIAFTCSVIGLFSMGFPPASNILSLIAMILLIISRKEFQ